MSDAIIVPLGLSSDTHLLEVGAQVHGRRERNFRQLFGCIRGELLLLLAHRLQIHGLTGRAPVFHRQDAEPVTAKLSKPVQMN
jgi:hypothetical protein